MAFPGFFFVRPRGILQIAFQSSCISKVHINIMQKRLRFCFAIVLSVLLTVSVFAVEIMLVGLHCI